MLDIPPASTPRVDVPKPTMIYCANVAAQHYKIDPRIILTIAKVEGGKIGTVSRNSNGTYDLGVMQLNTINLPKIRSEFPTVTARDLVFQPCINIYVGTWFLSEEIKKANGDIIRGIGNYHSRTPKFHQRYLGLFRRHYNNVSQGYNEFMASIINNQKTQRRQISHQHRQR